MNLIITGANLEDNYGNLVEFQKGNMLKMLDSYMGSSNLITIVLPRHFENLPIAEFLNERYPEINAKYVNKTRGALCSALLALDSRFMTGEIFIAPADSMGSLGYAQEIDNFLSSEAQAGTVFFEQYDSSWSYLRIRDESRIIEISEKRRISNFASTGFFMFRSASVFLEGAEWALKNSLITNGQYYLSGSLQSLLILNKAVNAFPLCEKNAFISFRNQTT
jgi:hypothetical protein